MHLVRGRCRIKSLLRQIGKSQVWLAQKMGRTPTQMSDWVNNRVPMHIDTAKLVVELLKDYIDDIVIDDLYEWYWEED